MASVCGSMVSTCFIPRKPTLQAIPNVGQALFGLKSGRSGRITCMMVYKVKLVTPLGPIEFECPDDVYNLDQAEETSHGLPYSCRNDSCSSCARKIIAGTVDQYDGSFLDEDQIADGFVLTCVAYPKSDVTIETHKEEVLENFKEFIQDHK